MEPYTRDADPSRDYTRYPTFAPLPASLLAPQQPVLLTLGAADPAAAEPTPHIIGLAAGQSHTIVLYSNGIVRAAGDMKDGKCDVSDWQNITAICAGNHHTVGLQGNGRVHLAGQLPAGKFHPEQWQDIEAIAGGPRHIVGLRTDGSLVFCGNSLSGQADLSKLAL